MKKPFFALFLISLSAFALTGCKEKSSLTGTGSNADLITRPWKGEAFITLNIGDSSRVIKDLVLSFEFKKDGSCSLSQASYSISSISGQWKFENGEKTIVLTMQRPMGTVAETLPVRELSSSRFVMGDTTFYGYSLVPM